MDTTDRIQGERREDGWYWQRLTQHGLTVASGGPYDQRGTAILRAFANLNGGVFIGHAIVDHCGPRYFTVVVEPDEVAAMREP